ncbi:MULTISPECIES: phage tail length tape measure family protein [Pseudomonas]|uniref:phage tail length tape measure family protein n=1 Tax=Pseudomonas TaxID=286 RepID=UPI0013DEB38C|nr:MULTISPECIES: phage tail length tape measure family protein [Pseudomonas]MCE0912073.1 phage tail length tape measure family protein [Pseudomonas kurunegalensis]QIG17863.1 tail length tape measure protein [Pseudomonas monteilii]QIG23120.1 tail length tape measure protein [Pseudomonas monteilii]WJR57610.1 phage tail length tape measure family protein [Pseudomonas kurunegalensis]
MAQESRLAVTIDSRGAKRNADDLTGSLERMERAGDAAAASADGVSSSLDDQRKELSQLLGQINPTVAALGRLDDMQEKLSKLKKAGIVESDTFVEYTQRINTMRDALGDTAEGMNKAGMSAKAYQAALRGVPAQFTDIAVSLQGGQAPLTVFLQQGGQLKDMFGGVAPAAKALGGYILGLVNPFTVAAAAAGALAVAYYKGSEQSDALRNSLILTGNFSKASEAQLISLAESADQVTGTFGQAAGALAQLTAAGENTTGNFKLITTTAVEMQRVTGKAVEETVAEFIKLGKDPVAGIVELDEKYRFLTASVYAQIKALSDQGNAVAAADLAERTYAEAMGQRTSKIRDNLGVIERGWLNIKDATNEVLDAFASIGRRSAESEESAIKKLQQELAYRNSLLNTGYEDDTTRSRIAEIEQELSKRQEILRVNQKTLEEEERRRRVQEEGRKSLDALDASYKSALTQTQRLNRDLADLDKAKAKAVEAGVFTAAEEAKYATARKNIEQEIADIKTREAKKNAPKNINRGVAEAENTFARLYGQYDPAAQAARALTKEQGQLDLALSKGKITQEEYSKALAQASINYAAALKGAQGLTAVEQYRAQLQRQLVNEQAQYQLDAASIGMGDLQASRMQQRLNLEMQTNDRLLQLQTELANATDEKQRQALQGQIDAINEFLPQQLAAMQAGWAQMDQAMLNPINGWTAAVQNFGNQARDIAGQTQSIFSSAFNNISADITDAIMSGQLSFSTLGDIASNVVREIITGFVRMGVQMALNAALNATLGTAAAGQSMILAGTTATAWAPAAAMASLATLGANSVPAAAALTSTTALATSLAVIPGFATGGYVSGSGTSTSDSIMARLSDGEFVVNASATRKNRALLEAINSGERVSTSSGSGAAGSVSAMPQPIVQIFEDPSKAGTSQVTREGNQDFIKVWVASVMGDGEADQALRAKYGLQGVGS